MVLAAPMLIAALLMAALDRTIQTGVLRPRHRRQRLPVRRTCSGSSGTPRCTSSRCRASGIVLELLPVFTRKPLWGYRLAVAGMLGDHAAELLRLAAPPVRERHQRRPAAVLHALDRADLAADRASSSCARWGRSGAGASGSRCRCCSASRWLFNFLIGGLSGVFLSDVPSDVTTHGSFFSMAHFHYTIMGGLIFTFFAAIYYWVPEDDRLRVQRAAGQDPLLDRCSSRSTRPSGRCS